MNESKQWLDVELSRDASFPPSPGFCLKRCLMFFRASRAPDEPWQNTGLMGQTDACPPVCVKCLLLVTIVLLFLGVAALLLFWNYQCIFVWGLCQEDQPAVPLFRGFNLQGVDVEEHT